MRLVTVGNVLKFDGQEPSPMAMGYDRDGPQDDASKVCILSKKFFSETLLIYIQ